MSFRTCRFCDECGGDYPTYAGEGVKAKSRGKYSRYHNKCLGDFYQNDNNANP